jgi:hypothetical protein
MILDNLLQVAAADPQLCRDLVHGVENGNHVSLSLTHATASGLLAVISKPMELREA